MKYLSTDYWSFKDALINEAIDYDKISGLKDRIKTLTQRVYNEKDSNRRRKLQLEIKVCELKIAIAQIP
jgi:hypothetical protein